MIKADTGIDINHNRIQRVMNASGLSSGAGRRWKKKNWIRYEREHSNELWHTDWHQIKDPRWKGLWLITYEDDSSRFVTGYGVFPPHPYVGIFGKGAEGGHRQVRQAGRDAVGPRLHLLRHRIRCQGEGAHGVREVPAQDEDTLHTGQGRPPSAVMKILYRTVAYTSCS